MTEQQKRGAAAVSVVIVGLSALFLLWLSVTVGRSAEGSSLGNHDPGRIFMLAIHNWDGLSLLLKGVPIILTLGISIIARYKLKDWQFYSLIALSTVGIGSCLYLYLELSTLETARKFWAYSPVPALETYAVFVDRAQGNLAVFGAWMVSLLGIQLGVKLT